MNEQTAPLPSSAPEPGETIKTCCATLYQSDLARLLLGDSFHPGGEALTLRLGTLLQLGVPTFFFGVFPARQEEKEKISGAFEKRTG